MPKHLKMCLTCSWQNIVYSVGSLNFRLNKASSNT